MINYNNDGYENILKPKLSSLAQVQTVSKSLQEHIEALSLKSEDAGRFTINREQMIFGSMSHRDFEAVKYEKMNHSQMSHQSGGNVLRVPLGPGKPVQI